MRVSEWLRQYQLSREMPDVPEGDPMIAFWGGWLIGASCRIELQTKEQSIDRAIKAAEFIESRAK